MPAHLTLGQLARPIERHGWLTAAVLAVALLTADARPDPPRRQVVYVGTRSPDTDSTFTRLSQALDKLPAAHRSRLQLSYQAVRDQGADAARVDLAQRRGPAPDVWVTPTADAAMAVNALAGSSPIVFASFPDPRRIGLASSLSRPGGRATGVMLEFDVHAKRLELLRDAAPGVRRVGVLLDTGWSRSRDLQASLIEPARALGLTLQLLVADDPEQLERLMQGEAIAPIEAWYIPATYIAYKAQAAIIAHLQRLRRPAMHATANEVESGALMAYSLDNSFVFDALAVQIAQVAMGQAAADLPIQRSKRFVLSVRPRTGPDAVAIDPSVIRRADRIY